MAAQDRDCCLIGCPPSYRMPGSQMSSLSEQAAPLGISAAGRAQGSMLSATSVASPIVSQAYVGVDFSQKS